MRSPHVDDFVRLTQDIPEKALNKGEVGVVRSTWFEPERSYEVEFHPTGRDVQTRCLLDENQMEVTDGPLMNSIGGAAFTGEPPSEYISRR